MLPRTSSFVLETLPFVLSALIGAFIVLGSVHSWARGSEQRTSRNAIRLVEEAHAPIEQHRYTLALGAQQFQEPLAYR